MIHLNINTQPDDETCGPTCLHAIYNYYGLDLPLHEVIASVDRSLSGGTLTPMLAKHALERGFKTTMYVSNIDIFDPTWFVHGRANHQVLIDKLSMQMQQKALPHLVQPSMAYQAYLKLGGTVLFNTVDVALLKKYFSQQIPVLTGLSATYLYRSARERYTEAGASVYDDTGGFPCGHFVVLCGYDDNNRHMVVADPHRQNPLSHKNFYRVSSNRLINAIMLGVLTYDAHLLIIEP